MKRLLLTIIICFCASSVSAQVTSYTAFRFRTLPTFTVCRAGDVSFTGGAFKGCTGVNTPVTFNTGASPGSTVPTTVQGDLLFGSAVNTLSALAKNASATRYLSNTGASNNPAWAQVNLANGVTGNLPVGSLNSGTNADSSHYWRGDGTWATVSAGITNSAGPNVLPVTIDPTHLGPSGITDDGNNIWAMSPTAGTLQVGLGPTPDDVSSYTTGLGFQGTTATLGDIAQNGFNTTLVIDDAARSVTAAASTESFAINGTAHTIVNTAAASQSFVTPNIKVTITTDTSATPTISTPGGVVRIASATSSITVTSTIVTTSSLIFASVRSNDATLKMVQAVPGTGSFVLYGNAAAAANADIQVWIINPN